MPDDDRFTEDDAAELMSRNKKLFGADSSDDEASREIRKLEVVRSKLATQIKLESMQKGAKPSPSAATSSTAPLKKSGRKFELNSLRECTPPNSVPKDPSSKFSFLKTLGNQPNKPSGSPISIDEDIINKIVTQPAAKPTIVNADVPSIDMTIIKQALETADKQRLALKYKVKPRSEAQSHPEPTTQSHHQPADPSSHSSNMQLVCFNDPRVSRDPRVQQDMRMQTFSPPPTPPIHPNYPPMLQSTSCYKPPTHPNPSFTAQQRPYPNAIMPPQQQQQHHLQQQSNLIAITPQVSNYSNNQRPTHHRQMSPVSSTDMSSRYQSAYPGQSSFVDASGMQKKKFYPTLNDNVERQKYEQARHRRSNDFYDKEPPPRDVPKTYGEYKRSLQSNVSSSTSERLDRSARPERPDRGHNESRTTAKVSTSHHDNVYRSGNYATPIPSVTTQPAGSKFKIPKKSTLETANKLGHTTDISDAKDLDEDQSNSRVVKDLSDSELEISAESSDQIRDPRVRAQAQKKAASSSSTVVENKPPAPDNKSKEAAENNVVTSSTSIIPESVSTPDNMEFFKHLTNPNNLLALINIVGQMSDDSTFAKVKEVLEKAKETNVTPALHEEVVTELATPTTAIPSDKVEVPKTPRKKSKNELEKLNEDIRTMFISDGVLNATGRRVCALYNNTAADNAKEAAKTTKPVKRQAKDDVSVQKKSEFPIQLSSPPPLSLYTVSVSL